MHATEKADECSQIRGAANSCPLAGRHFLLNSFNLFFKWMVAACSSVADMLNSLQVPAGISYFILAFDILYFN